MLLEHVVTSFSVQQKNEVSATQNAEKSRFQQHIPGNTRDDDMCYMWGTHANYSLIFFVSLLSWTGDVNPENLVFRIDEVIEYHMCEYARTECTVSVRRSFLHDVVKEEQK